MIKRLIGKINPLVAPAEDGGGPQAPQRMAPAGAPNTNPVATAQPVVPPPPAPPPPPTAPTNPLAANPVASGQPNTNPVPAAATPGLMPVPGGLQTPNATDTGGYTPAPGAFGGEALGGEVAKFGSEAMSNPSRYDSGVVKKGLDVINADAAKATTDRMRGLSELMAKRHIVGSSIEGDSARNLLSDIEATRSRSATDLALDQARTFAQDRASAGQLGQSATELQRELGGDRENANRYGYEAGRTAANTAEDTRRYNQGYGLAERQQTADERNNELARLLQAYASLGAAA
jgi:hypothetical protein